MIPRCRSMSVDLNVSARASCDLRSLAAGGANDLCRRIDSSSLLDFQGEPGFLGPQGEPGLPGLPGLKVMMVQVLWCDGCGIF